MRTSWRQFCPRSLQPSVGANLSCRIGQSAWFTQKFRGQNCPTLFALLNNQPTAKRQWWVLSGGDNLTIRILAAFQDVVRPLRDGCGFSSRSRTRDNDSNLQHFPLSPFRCGPQVGPLEFTSPICLFRSLRRDAGGFIVCPSGFDIPIDADCSSKPGSNPSML